MPNYGQMADEELIRRYREGDRDALDHIMEKYKDQVRKEANAMYLLGGENEDLIQEGMIGLFKAASDLLLAMYGRSIVAICPWLSAWPSDSRSWYFC